MYIFFLNIVHGNIKKFYDDIYVSLVFAYPLKNNSFIICIVVTTLYLFSCLCIRIY